MLNGTAMAAASDQDNTAQSTVIINNEATVSTTQSSVEQVAGTAATETKPSQEAAGSSQTSPSSGPVVSPVAPSPLTSISSKDAAVIPAITAETVTSPQPISPEQSVIDATSVQVLPIMQEARTQLTPTRTGWVMVPSPGDATVAAVQPEIANAIAAAAAALPPVNTPVVPKGLFGQWSQELVGVTLSAVVSGLVAFYSGFQNVDSWLVLGILLLGILGMTYGAWLRRVGHVTAARSDMISLFFATPLLMDFIRVSPPERGPFLGVADINSYIINNSQKGAEL